MLGLPPPGDALDYDWLRELTQEQFDVLVRTIPPEDRYALLAWIEEQMPPPPPWTPHAYQVPPPVEEPWFGWLLMGGRGIGKTATITHYMDDHANGPPCFRGKVPHRMGIIAPTFGDASASIVHGEDGIAVINPDVKRISMDGFSFVRWPNGSIAYLFGVNTQKDVQRLRARTNRCLDVREEIAAWPYLRDGMDQADFGLRGGPHPRWIGATTPRPRPTIRALDADTDIVKSKATTADNPSLDPEVKKRLYDRFGNTTLGRQELYGDILEEVSGALWRQELIEQWRVAVEDVPRLLRVRTYVDPSWGTTNDECGIVVCGLGANRHVYVLDDLSARTTPEEWALLAAMGKMPPRGKDGQWAVDVKDPEAFPPKSWFGRRSEMVKAEKNFQAWQVRDAMKLASTALGRRIPFDLVNASQGKRLRAEPVMMAYEQGRVHHVGRWPELEWQMTTWVPPEAGEDAGDPGDPEETPGGAEGQDSSKWSPDRLDALVYGVTDLLLRPGAGTGKVEVADGRVPQTKIVQGEGKAMTQPMVGGIPAVTRQGRLLERQMAERRQASSRGRNAER